MKKVFISIKVIIVFLLGCFSLNCVAQESSNFSRYRVVSKSIRSPLLESVSNEVKVYPKLNTHFPTAFSPNGDGLNDTFGVFGEGVGDYKMIVSNRYGEIVFESESVDDMWDGTFRGETVPNGTYAYEAVLEGYEKGRSYKQGFVMITR